ncbi:hypothetical protein HL670_02391 [Serratia plymuthica]|uniref:Gp138 family membrane-puncturing spike protein n=1 Tax=Serratia plymuthica TaxID=82996 RepID=UPI00034A2601|nr:Gp138 family membrane-puncturing spike protein [Serratia plymuthica]QJW55505.1 hypothetical protein HL670_02391 [Serratia plymuthica]
MRVLIPGIIQSFDMDTVTCVVLQAVKGHEPESAGGGTAGLPLLVDVPVVFPCAGAVIIQIIHHGVRQGDGNPSPD